MQSALAERWSTRGLRTVVRCGVELPRDHGDAEAERRALDEGAGIVDRTVNEVVSVRGSDARDFVHRLTTQEIRGAEEGTAIPAAFVTAKGRLMHVVDLWIDGDEIVIVGRAPGDGAIRSSLDRFHFAESLEIRDASDRFRALAVHGPAAKRVIEAALGVTIPEPAGVCGAELDGFACRVVRTSPVAGAGYQVLVPPAGVPRVFDRLVSEGAVPVGEDAFESRRIEDGLPAPPGEVGEKFNPHEVGLRGTIRLDKGCYVGQEVLARLETYDKVSRRLVRLEPMAGSDVTPTTFVEALAGAQLARDGRVVGEVTSVGEADRSGGFAALGVVKKDAAEAGTELELIATAVEGPVDDNVGRAGLAEPRIRVRVVGLGGEPAPPA